MGESKSRINTHLSFLQQAEDHAARSRQLYDSFVEYVYSLNAGGIAVVMGIAAATIKQMINRLNKILSKENYDKIYNYIMSLKMVKLKTYLKIITMEYHI